MESGEQENRTSLYKVNYKKYTYIIDFKCWKTKPKPNEK